MQAFMPKQAAFLAALLFAAVGTPFLAAWVLHVAKLPGDSYEYVNTATLAGMMVGGLAGIRSRSLAQLFIGPAIGLLAGVLDVRVLGCLVGRLEWPVSVAWSVPTYGLVLGLWVATSRRRWWSALLAVIAVAAADLLARVCWSRLMSSGDTFLKDWQQLRWLLVAGTYVPTAMLTVGLMRPAAGDVEASNDEGEPGA